MIIPPYLKTGDTIAIVSTASRIDRQSVEPAIHLLTGLGFKVQTGEHAFSSFNQYSATDNERASDLQTMLDNPLVKAIICSRGGYGTLRTLQHICWEKFIENPKWIIGFSDVTVLHSALNTMGYSSIHGVMPRYFIEEEEPTASFKTLLNAMIGEPLTYKLPPIPINRTGEASGILIGGNLSMLYSLRGTPYDIDTNGKILFIEDLSEYLYHLDRMMLNLKTGGKLNGLAGLVVGSFTGMKDLEVPYGKTSEEIILDSVEAYRFPVVFHFPAGHGNEKFALKMGMDISLSISGTGSTIIQK